MGEITDLKEFTSLRGINASNNQFTNLDFLATLPNKDKLKSLNLFGNRIKEIDFAALFNDFPNLEKINLQNNPLSAKNLNNLTAEQFIKLVKGIKEKKIQVNSYQGTVLMDLLEYAQTTQGNTNTHAAYLQELVKQGSQKKAEVIKTAEPNNNQIQPKNPNNSTYLLVGGLVLLIASVLAIGYWLGKRKRATQMDEFEEF